jgi:hypothetical protein
MAVFESVGMYGLGEPVPTATSYDAEFARCIEVGLLDQIKWAGLARDCHPAGFRLTLILRSAFDAVDGSHHRHLVD